VRRFAESLQAQQAVTAVEGFTAVADLVVDVTETPIRERIGILGNVGEQADGKGGFVCGFAPAVYAVEGASPFVPMYLAAIAAGIERSPQVADRGAREVGRGAVLRGLCACEGRERLVRGTVVVVRVGDDVVRRAIMLRAELEQLLNPFPARAGRAADAQRGIDRLDRVVGRFPKLKERVAVAAPEPAVEVGLIP